MAETFIWAIDDGPQSTTRFRVTKTALGDGYTQRVSEGLNNRVRRWPVTITGSWAELDEIEDFILRHEGYISFNWTPPGPNATPGLWLIEEYSFMPRSGEQGTINATFVEEFAP